VAPAAPSAQKVRFVLAEHVASRAWQDLPCARVRAEISRRTTTTVAPVAIAVALVACALRVCVLQRVQQDKQCAVARVHRQRLIQATAVVAAPPADPMTMPQRPVLEVAVCKRARWDLPTATPIVQTVASAISTPICPTVVAAAMRVLHGPMQP
jgi:hypothetical protein